MTQNVLFPGFLWALAAVFTLAMAWLQNTTGPTHPVSGKASIGSETYTYCLKRSHELAAGEPRRWDMPVEMKICDPEVAGIVVWKRYKYDEPQHIIAMIREKGILRAKLPYQPPAGKLEYQVILHKNGQKVVIPGVKPVVTRFKGDVPLWALLPHVLLMFIGLLFAARTALSALFSRRIDHLVWITISLFILGGLLFGPIVQKYAFGAYWTGWPLGDDWTDSKTAMMVLVWVPALWLIRGRNNLLARGWTIAAMLVTFAVYLIPHSMHGSELDYNKLNQGNSKTRTSLPAKPPDSE